MSYFLVFRYRDTLVLLKALEYHLSSSFKIIHLLSLIEFLDTVIIHSPSCCLSMMANTKQFWIFIIDCKYAY